MRAWWDQTEWAERLSRPWKPVSTAALVAWLAGYGLFLLYAWRSRGQPMLLDNFNMIMHEGGHMLFGWLGQTAMIWGGTLLQLLVPLALAFYFALQRRLTGVAFGIFLFFENFLGISVYMADARAMQLDLVSTGAPDAIIHHDWNVIFSHWQVLHKDRQIAAAVSTLGWLGMTATMAWLAWKAPQTRR